MHELRIVFQKELYFIDNIVILMPDAKLFGFIILLQ